MKKLIFATIFSVLAFSTASAQKIGSYSFSVPAGFELIGGNSTTQSVSIENCLITVKVVNSSSARSAYNELYGDMGLAIAESSQEGVSGANEMAIAMTIQANNGEYIGISAFWGMRTEVADRCMSGAEAIIDSLRD